MHPSHPPDASLSHGPDPRPASGRRKGSLALSIGALGVVYGDIGTSPLYALDVMFRRRHGLPVAPAHVIGGLSLVIWALTLVIALKYGVFVLRADNDGEGGVFSRYALLDRFRFRAKSLMTWALLLGAGLLFGDGIITPAISVLSAVEGVAVATPMLSKIVIALTIGILTLLFAVQRKGTGGLGRVFGPIMVVWFTVIAMLGMAAIARHPEIVEAFNPVRGVEFLRQGGWGSGLLVSVPSCSS